MIRHYNRFDDLIRLKSLAAGVDPVVIKAIVQAESAFDSTAKRNEPAFYRRYIKDRPRWKKCRYYSQPEIIAAGIGLMQVQYTTALWMGFAEGGHWYLLFDPSINIRYGIAWYRNRLHKYEHTSMAISAYNCGTPKRIGSRFANQTYVDKVYGFADQVRADWAATDPP